METEIIFKIKVFAKRDFSVLPKEYSTYLEAESDIVNVFREINGIDLCQIEKFFKLKK